MGDNCGCDWPQLDCLGIVSLDIGNVPRVSNTSDARTAMNGLRRRNPLTRDVFPASTFSNAPQILVEDEHVTRALLVLRYQFGNPFIERCQRRFVMHREGQQVGIGHLAMAN